MLFFSRLSSLFVRCRSRILWLRQGQILRRLSPENRGNFSALLQSCPEYASSLWRLAERLSRLDMEWALSLRRAPGLAVLELRLLDLDGSRVCRLPLSLRRLLAGAEREASPDGVFLYRVYLSEQKTATGVRSPLCAFRRAG